MPLEPVFCIAGNGGNPNNLKYQLSGLVLQDRDFVQLSYPNNGVDDWRIVAGAAALDQAFHDFVDLNLQMYAFGHQMGATVIDYWIATYGPDSDIDPELINFITIGDPWNKYGGTLYDKTVVIPNDKFTATHYIRQYDGYADYPGDATNDDAVTNASIGAYSLNPDYYNVPLDPGVAGNYSYVEGTFTYVWNRTFPMPIVQKTNPTLSEFGITQEWLITDEIKVQDQTQRPAIDAAYAVAGSSPRPVVIPPPDYS